MNEYLHIKTPLIVSPILSKIVGREVYLKLENCQPSHSFKLRGIGLLCCESARKGATRFISSSGGNAGLAAAYAGKMLNIQTTVFVPESTPKFMRDRIQLEGAEVVVKGRVWDEA